MNLVFCEQLFFTGKAMEASARESISAKENSFHNLATDSEISYMLSVCKGLEKVYVCTVVDSKSMGRESLDRFA